MSGSKASSPSESQASASQIDFQFLNFSHPSDAKASRARRTVRSHVTRQQHKAEHAAAAARRAKSYPQPETEPQEVPHRPAHAASFPLERPTTLDLPTRPAPSGSSDASSQSPSPTGSPMNSIETRIDPTDIYPDAWHPCIPRILVSAMEHCFNLAPLAVHEANAQQDYYLSYIAVDIPDVDGPHARGLLRSRFFPFVLTDPAPLHSVMLIAASHYGNAYGSKSHTIDILQLKDMAYKEINSAIGDPVRQTSDQLIAAVAKMAAYEALFGNQQSYKTHMTGLLRMVSMRGGLPAMGLDGLLERMLLWIDSNAAFISGSDIFFDRAAFPTNVRHPQPDPEKFTGGLRRSAPA